MSRYRYSPHHNRKNHAAPKVERGLKQRSYPYIAAMREEEAARLLNQKEKDAMNRAKNDPLLMLHVERPGQLQRAAAADAEKACAEASYSDFESFMLYAEIRLKDELSQSRISRREARNMPLIAVCCELLLRLGRAFPQCSTLVKLIAREMARGIYLDFDEETFIAESDRWSQSYGPLRSMIGGAQPPEQASFLHTWTPFFAVVEAQTKALKVAETKVKAFRGAGLTAGQLSEKRQRLMMNAIQKWQSMLLRRCFDNWRRANQMRKRQLSRLRQRRTRIYFDAWQMALLQKRCDTLQAFNRELEEEVALLEENTLELRDQRDALKVNKKELEKSLDDAKNVELQQSDNETRLKEELAQVKRERDLLREILESYRKQDLAKIESLLGKPRSSNNTKTFGKGWDLPQHIYKMYQADASTRVQQPNRADRLAQRKKALEIAGEEMKAEKPEDTVMRWANHHLQSCGIRTSIENMSSHLKDGEKLAAIISSVCGESMAPQDETGSANTKESNSKEEEHVQKRKVDSKENEGLENETGTINRSANQDENSANTTFYESVAKELDPSKRVTMCVQGANNFFEMPETLIEEQDILSGDADSNFAFLSYLFVMHPGLDDQSKLQIEWKRQWEILRSYDPPSSPSFSALDSDHNALNNYVRPFKETRQMRQELEDVAEFDLKSQNVYWDASRKVLRMLIGELSARLRGSTGTMSAMEESKEMKTYSCIPTRKIADLLDIEEECKAASVASNAHNSNAKTKGNHPWLNKHADTLEAQKSSEEPSRHATHDGVTMDDKRDASTTAQSLPSKVQAIQSDTVGAFDISIKGGIQSRSTQPAKSEKLQIAEAELAHLENYLGKQYKDLKKIFRAYGALGGGAASTISRGEFATLMKDIRVYDKSFTPAEADIIFLRSNWELDAETGDLRASADRSLTCTEFVEALVRIAQARFSSQQTTTLKGCVEALFNRCLIPFAQRSDVDRFRKLLRQKRVQDVFAKYQSKLKMVFLETAGNDDTIQLDEFTRFLKKQRHCQQHVSS